MHPLEAYLHDLRELHTSGAATKETSYYPALKELIDSVGRPLTPPVRCIVNPASVGAGIPDVALYTPDQLQHAGGDKARRAALPARGVVEVKGTADEVLKIAGSDQVRKYLDRYRQVLVTNYRDFLLMGLDERGLPEKLERFSLAASEAAFWSAVEQPGALAAAQGDALIAYLQRALIHAAPLATPQDVASALASYARISMDRVEKANLPALTAVRGAFEEALGISFQGEKGDHFFRSTLVQTLFYGMFSAWVLWSKEHAPGSSDRFDWRTAGWTLQVPAISFLFEQVAQPSKLKPLDLVDVLNWTGDALNRVDRDTFFRRFEEEHAVQYFYEPFLQEFDPELRREYGVWYTPVEVVRYMVARVDAALREELGIAKGLADPRVYVLDPCCGTGTYLVEVIQLIASRLEESGADALTAQDIKRAACERVFGFELLPAPFVVAHLQLGLLLQKLGAPLSDDKSERAGVYLTNALTGWQPPEKAKQTIMFAELEQERDAAEHVKREAPILVILGNPPYNGFAGLAVGEEQDLTSAYRKASGTQQPQGQGLNDLYVRFYRMAERRIAEQTGEGIVCYISNYSWLDGLSFTAMRERYLAAFDSVWVDNLNGDKYKTGKRTPTGESDPSIFSTEWNHEGIQVGTAIALLVRKHEHVATSAVQFRQLWGKDKRACLLADSANHAPPHYQTLMPADALGLPFLPVHTQAGYGDWPRLPELFPVSFPGVKTSRDDVVVDIDRVRLIRRMTDYFDQSISHERMRAIAPGAMESTGRFRAEYVRDQLRKRGFLADKIVPYYYRPFDVRWLYWEPETDLLDRKRDDYFPHIFDGNTWIEARQKQPMERFDRGFPVVTLADNLGNGLSSYFPLFLRGQQRASLFETGSDAEVTPNLSAAASDYLSGLHADPSSLFYHVLTMLHAPAYRSENAGALRQDWPRVPLPDDAATLEAGATLGRQLFALFDAQMPVLGVTGAPLRTELRAVGGISRVDGKPLDAEHDLDLTAGWGFAGQGGVTMAGKGRAVARPYKAAEMESLRLGAGALGLSPEEVLVLLGPETYDIWLNEVAYWCNVPTRVWEYTIGGYQVLKKWLSYRERRLLGRGLRQEEAREVGGIARRIAAILLLGPALDAQYRAAIAAPQAWPGQAGRSAT